jgi:hypothetical protein
MLPRKLKMSLLFSLNRAACPVRLIFFISPP